MKCIIFLYLALFSSIINAATTFDTHGSKDHELLGRYPGFFINAYSEVEYDQASIVVAPYNIENKKAPVKTLEGKVTNILYDFSSSKPQQSLLQLHKNYEQALLKLNADIIFMCKSNECLNSSKPLSNFSMADFGGWLRSTRDILKGIGGQRVLNGPDSSFLVARIKRGNTLTHVMISIGVSSNYSLIAMSFIESASMATDKVRITSAQDIDLSIKKHGKVVLNGIFFDHDKAIIKDESKITLTAIAQYLKSESSTFYVVGHTDATGDYGYNVNLSNRRAKSVVDTLKTSYGISVQLIPVGIGPVSPAANNATKEGKEKNRRVELVRVYM
ncbi:MAG: OmpA family protein [Cellvibrionaceae bacterium]